MGYIVDRKFCEIPTEQLPPQDKNINRKICADKNVVALKTTDLGIVTSECCSLW